MEGENCTRMKMNLVFTTSCIMVMTNLRSVGVLINCVFLVSVYPG